ncbi:MAG: mandelate racemase/muconate lactonizing enzyme family protein [Clostridiales bacterium]|nr:mandelate racemase/muconate lactonizing enzyme family protein [Clostridiales bacterium]
MIKLESNNLRITDIRVAYIDGLPKSMILLKVYTNSDIIGYGELRDASSASYALLLKSRVLGENPLDVNKLFNRVKQFGYHSRQGGGVSGIICALYDIVGKYYGIPLYQLLGGKYRDKVRLYCDTDVSGRHTGRDMGMALKKRMDDGYTFLKMDLGIELLLDEPGALNAPSGMIEDIKKYSLKAIQHQSGSIDRSLMYGKNYEVFTIPHWATGIHITEYGLDILEEYLRQVREVIGYEIPLAVDHFGHLAVEDAVRFARRAEKYNLAWMEDIAPWNTPSQLEKFTRALTQPICTGEDIYLAENFRDVLEAGVGVVHPDVLTIGGPAEIMSLGKLCGKYGAAMAIHMAESPIGFMAAVHCAAALEQVLAVEMHSVDYEDWYKLINPNVKIKDGFVSVPETPGLGIESLNEELIEKYRTDGSPKPWTETENWNNEWSNDRIWS